jgi:hypothetical protein
MAKISVCTSNHRTDSIIIALRSQAIYVEILPLYIVVIYTIPKELPIPSTTLKTTSKRKDFKSTNFQKATYRSTQEMKVSKAELLKTKDLPCVREHNVGQGSTFCSTLLVRALLLPDSTP